MSDDANRRLQKALELDETLATQRVNLARAVNSDVFARVGRLRCAFTILFCIWLEHLALPQVHNTNREVDYELQTYMQATAAAKQYNEHPGGAALIPDVDGHPPRNEKLGTLGHQVAGLHDRVVGESLVGGSHRIRTPLPRGGVLEGIDPRLWPHYERHRLRHRQTTDHYAGPKHPVGGENVDPKHPVGGENVDPKHPVGGEIVQHGTVKPAATTQTSGTNATANIILNEVTIATTTTTSR